MAIVQQGVRIHAGDLSYLSTDRALVARDAITTVLSADGRRMVDPVFVELGDGGYVAVSGRAVQRYDSSGEPVGPTHLLADTTPVDQVYSSRLNGDVSRLANGDLVATWSERGVYVQRLDASGLQVGGLITVAAGGRMAQSAAIADGGYVVTWSDPQGEIRGQRFDAGGATAGGAFTVSARPGEEYFAQVEALDNGGFVVSWVLEGSPRLVMAQRYDSAGQAVGAAATIETNSTGAVALTALDGGYAIVTSVWTPSETVSVRIFDNAGNLIASDLAIAPAYTSSLSVEKLDGGDLVVAWSDQQNLYLQRYSPTGERLGAPDVFETGSMPSHAIVALEGGGFLLSYARSGIVTHQIFTEYAAHTLTPGPDTVTADADDTLVVVSPGQLGGGDNLDGGGGENVLRLASAGTYNLNQPAILTGFQVLQGSVGDDVVLGSAARLAGLSVLDGGAGADQVRLTTAGVVDLTGAVNLEQFVGSTGDDTVILGASRPAGLLLDSGGGVDTLIVSGLVDVSALNLTGQWHVTAMAGEAATLRLNNAAQIDFAHGESSTVTVEGDLALTPAQRAQLFSQGVDYVVRPEAVFTPTGGISRAGTAFAIEQGPYGASGGLTASLADGGYFTVWQRDTGPGGLNDLFAQRFDAAGQPVGATFTVNTTTTGQQYGGAVDALAGGDVVVTWTSPDGVFAQRFSAAGARIGGEVALSPVADGARLFADVAALKDGGYLISWLIDGPSTNTIHLQRFDAAGVTTGPVQTIASPGIYSPGIAALADGGFAVTWASRLTNLGSDGDIYVQRFTAAGSTAGAAVEVDMSFGSQDQPVIAGLANGGYVVAWRAEGGYEAPNNVGVYIQRYDTTGAAVGNRVLVNTITQDYQSGPTLAALADGGWAVGWTSSGSGQAYLQRFTVNGEKVGGEMRVDPSSSFQQQMGAITAWGDGFVVSWARDGVEFVRGFGALVSHQLTTGADALADGPGDSSILVSPTSLGPGDSLSGGLGTDTLESLAPGVLDLSAPAVFSGIEQLSGSSGADTWLITSDRAVGLTAILAGAGVDRLELTAPGLLDLSRVAMTGLEQISGTSGADTLLGGAGPDSLDGQAGDDVLGGGPGNDTLDGGAGSDTASYANATAGVTVNLSLSGARNTGGAGFDTLVSIENLIGSNFTDRLTGDAAANRLDGGAGFDSLSGGGGADTLVGGPGGDALYGGLGDDTYLVTEQGHLAYEMAGEGTDTVTTTGDYYLYANIENLTLSSGAGAILGVGNELANVLTGNASANTLLGGLGDDTVNGGDGADRVFGEGGTDFLNGQGGDDYLVGGDGADLMDGGEGGDALYGQDGIDMLIGGAGVDTLIGGAGNDALNGASGAGEQDLMDGGAGDDDYLVDAANDLTFEAAGGGTDTVTATMGAGGGYYLYANVENLLLIGQTAYGVGNELANVITGNEFGNWLLGGDGNDTLNGKVGNDVLFGQGGADTFVFQRGTGGDVIGDFQVGVDKIQLTGIFTSFDQVHNSLHQNGGDTAIDLGAGDFVVLNGVAAAALTAADFVF